MVYCVWWLGSQVRVPLTAWMFVSCVCCVGSGLCDGLVTHPEEYYRLCMSNFVLPRNLNNGPEFRCCATENKIECSSIAEFALASVVGRQCLCSLRVLWSQTLRLSSHCLCGA